MNIRTSLPHINYATALYIFNLFWKVVKVAAIDLGHHHRPLSHIALITHVGKICNLLQSGSIAVIFRPDLLTQPLIN
jgi:hypothetical protein